MTSGPRWMLIGAVTVGVGCQTRDVPTSPEGRGQGSDEVCVESTSERVDFADRNLEAAVRAALRLHADQVVTCAAAATILELDASAMGITSLGGIESLRHLRVLALWGNELETIDPLGHLPELEGLSLRANHLSDVWVLEGLTELLDLDLGENAVEDLRPLARLTGLTTLLLSDNLVTDVGPLRELTELANLNLQQNAGLADIGPLLENPGLGQGSVVRLTDTSVSCGDIAALVAKGVEVVSDCP